MNIIEKKILCFLGLLLFIHLSIWSQENCPFYKQAIEEYENGLFQNALNNFQLANDCRNLSDDNKKEINDWIIQTLDTINKELVKAKNTAELQAIYSRALYVNSVAKEQYNNGSVDKALRFAQLAFMIDSTNKSLLKEISSYYYNTFNPLSNIVLVGHQFPISFASFSPDDSLIITVSTDNTCRIWNTQGSIKYLLEGHSEIINSAIFSQNGNKVLTASDDSTAILWNLDSGQKHILRGHKGGVTSGKFLADENLVTTGKDGHIIFWDTLGKVKNVYSYDDRKNIQTAILSPSCKYALSYTYDDEEGVVLFDINRSKICQFNTYIGYSALTEKKFNGHTGWLVSAAFSNHEDKIVTTSMDQTVILWNIKGKVLFKYPESKSTVDDAVFAPDDSLLLTVSQDHTASLWDLDGKNHVLFREHSDRINSILFSQSGRQLLTASSDKTCKLWSLDGSIIKNLRGEENEPIYYSCFSHSGNKVLSCSQSGTAKIWNINEPNYIKISEDTYEGITGIEFSPDNDLFITVSSRKINLFNIKGKFIKEILSRPGEIDNAVFSPNGRYVLAILNSEYDQLSPVDFKFHKYQKHQLILISLKDGQSYQLNGHQEKINTAVFSNDGNKIVTSSNDSTIKLWNLKGNLERSYRNHNGIVTSALFSKDGEKILSSSYDSTAMLIDLAGNILTKFKGHKAEVNSAVFSPNGQYVLTASFDNTAILWNLKGDSLASFIDRKGIVKKAIFSNNGDKILSYSTDFIPVLWDINGNKIADFIGHVSPITSISFSPDDEEILTSSDDGTAKIWDLQGNIITVYTEHTAEVTKAAYSNDGKLILTSSVDKTIHLWKNPLEVYGNIQSDQNRDKLYMKDLVKYKIKLSEIEIQIAKRENILWKTDKTEDTLIQDVLKELWNIEERK